MYDSGLDLAIKGSHWDNWQNMNGVSGLEIVNESLLVS